MASKRPPTERVVLLIATLVALGGIVGSAWVATSAPATDRLDVDGDVADRYESIRGVDGTRTTTIERNGTVASNRTYAVQLRPGTGEKRLSFVDGTESKWDERVSNGSVLWLHDRDSATASRIPLSGTDDETTDGEQIARLFARLNATDGADGGSADPPTVEPLPVVPRTPTGQPTAAAGDATFDVRYVGTETVADREAYVVRIAPVDDGAANYEQTLWLDAERFFPLQQRTAWTHDGERTVLTTTYEEVRFDPGLDDATFAPDFPPATSVRVHDTPETTTYPDVSALRQATDVAVPDPTVPPTYELAYATRTDGQVKGVGLRYANSTSVITVAKYNFTYATDGSDEQVTIDGQTAKLTRGGTVSLSWTCEDYQYTVRGTGVSADAVVEVGESIGCPHAGA